MFLCVSVMHNHVLLTPAQQSDSAIGAIVSEPCSPSTIRRSDSQEPKKKLIMDSPSEI